MKRHERVHTGDKPFSCSQCDKKFALAYILKTHKRIHIDEKPFSCKRCDYKCKQSIALKTHERIHTDEKPFSCSQCGYKCSTSGSLRRMYEPTLVISHSAAKSVNTNANNQVHWIHTKESTPMRNHLAFIFSKRDKVLVSQVEKMAFANMLGGSQEPTIYSSKELCSDQNLTSDFSGLLKNPLMKAELYQVPIFIPTIYFHNFTHTVVLRGLLKTCVHCCAVAITKKKKDCEAISLFHTC